MCDFGYLCLSPSPECRCLCVPLCVCVCRSAPPCVSPCFRVSLRNQVCLGEPLCGPEGYSWSFAQGGLRDECLSHLKPLLFVSQADIHSFGVVEPTAHPGTYSQIKRTQQTATPHLSTGKQAESECSGHSKIATCSDRSPYGREVSCETPVFSGSSSVFPLWISERA